MSYLLRNRNAANTLSGGGQSKVSRFLPPNRNAPTGMYRLSGGGAQLQVQRQPQVVQQEPARQQLRVPGVISMEEVLADLRILETQQLESERKLQYARVAKQRRLEQQTSLEERLDKCKYLNGQQRAELQRAHELLKDGQRQLSTARSAAAKAGDDLRDFDRKLKIALEIKLSLIAHQQMQDRLIEVLNEKVANIDQMKWGSEQRFNKTKQDVQNAKRFEETLRLDISNEIVRHQRITDQTAKMEAESLDYTQNVDSNMNQEASLKHQIESVENECNVLKIQEMNKQESFKSHKEKHKKFMFDVTAEHDCHKELISEKTTHLRQLWFETTSVQKSEGHVLSPLPSASSSPPILDLDRIRDSVNAEVVAVTEESIANEQLAVSVDDLQKQLSNLQEQRDKNGLNLTKLQAANLNGLQGVEERQVSIDNLRLQYEYICKTIDEKVDAKRQLLLIRNVEIIEQQKVLNSLSQDVQEGNSVLVLHIETVSGIDDDILDIKAQRDELKSKHFQKLSKLENELATVRFKIEELRDTSAQKTKEVSSSNMTLEERNRRKQIDDANKKIAKILEVYPEIDKIIINYRPDLSDHEQAQIDLKRFVQKCKKRTNTLDTTMTSKGEQVPRKAKLVDLGGDEDSQFKKRNAKSIATKDRCDNQNKSIGESTTKPRSLLPTFLQAKEMAFSKLDGQSSNPVRGVVSTEELFPASEKKVHWHRDCVESEDLENIENVTKTALDSVQRSTKRKVFGSDGPLVGERSDVRGTKKNHSDDRSRFGEEQPLEPRSKSDSKRRRFSKHERNTEAFGSMNRHVKSPANSDEKFDNGNGRMKSTALPSRNLKRETSNSLEMTRKTGHQNAGSFQEQPKSKADRLEFDGKEKVNFEAKTKQKTLATSDRKESKTQKKRVSSSQFSGISSQERPSKGGRRRKRLSSGASVGSKPTRTNFAEEEYNFSFTM